MADPVILSDTKGAVAVLTFNRPAALNAIDAATLKAFEAAFITAEADPAVRVIVITGAGDKAFVAGGDIGDLESRQGLAHYLEFGEELHRVFSRVEACDKPTIAAVNGFALGGGTELLLCTDMRLVADTARLGLPEINLGLFPGAGGTQRLIREIAPCRAREMMFTGSQITAQEAVEIGLCNRVVPKAELMAEAMKLAERCAAKSPLILKLLKRTLRQGAQMPLPQALAHEQAMIGLVLDAADAHEGCRAFLEKRPAAFTGR
ncbi:enoyl-CoA hydratase/isomerase family protein [Roseomonas sp. HJA6]|uniref:Enoyl-CoA hydratase/isomerase family protein n=1 Tax=Roseomonas alba TaxID=2846776 RepID=A0ABS7AG65_9PROT|nr:enoyl-CoA hydratase/isomerase family protein [Neoroseomonas alba]MBW6401298.1 enoyl-CoA hydratase/isomerase family protein [Neoroseomonas alba]